jgi:RNA recognition motif-containing protein
MKALAMSGVVMKGRPLIISEAHEGRTPMRRASEPRPVATPPSAELTTRVYVAGLPYASRENEVRDLFRGHDLSPVEVYVSVDRATGKSRGYAFVSLPTQEDAARAIGALNGSIVEGRQLVVRPAAPRNSSPLPTT